MLLGVDKKSVCVIGDTAADVLGAKQFGVVSILALWSQEVNMNSFRDLSPDFLVKEPKECSKLIALEWKGV